MTPLQAALTWRALGVATIPVRFRNKRPLIDWNEFRERLPTTRELHGWFASRPVNLALVCGWQGLVVIDFDDHDIYGAWRAWALAGGGMATLVAELSYQVRTVRGVHVYVALDDPPPGSRKLDRIDVKAAGGYVLAPPSVHPSGASYTPLDPRAPIIRTGSLEDVLPAALLAQPEPEMQPVRPRRVDELPADPWQAAWEPARVAGDDVGLVAVALGRLDLRALLPHPLYQRGQRVTTRCPLHDDHDPSLVVDLQAGKVYCFAGCTRGYWYDAIDLYAALNNMALSEAIHELAG